MSAGRKRFIAGAVCPKCGMLDRIVVFREEEKDLRECVSCGFRDELRLQQAPAPLSTRVQQMEVRPVRLPDGQDK